MVFFLWGLKLARQSISDRFFFSISFYFGRRLSSATGFGVLTFKSSVFRCAKYTVSSSRNRVQTKRWILVNHTVLAMQTASQQNAIEIVIMGWLIPGRRALTVTFCGLRVDEFYRVVMRQVWEITQSTVCLFFASSQYIRGFVEHSEAVILVIKWLTSFWWFWKLGFILQHTVCDLTHNHFYVVSFICPYWWLTLVPYIHIYFLISIGGQQDRWTRFHCRLFTVVGKKSYFQTKSRFFLFNDVVLYCS